ncbi:WD40 repeat 2 [Fusarium subglutinans]|uniref:WD40 repeat 2 n=1 Tax=Gibberella subglutinans TaxID=42677 RepID=A0A8H5P656_GIBSU|nr:WD40 repeat 2 [Fusarium subglutinans]KAF5588820.1 WD40 repeat 2 [Fusarium subglutinans]
MLPYPQGPALTSAQEKLLWDNDVVRNLTEEQWKAFGQWVGANDPTPLEAKYWITKENDLDLNIFSLQTLALLVKHAKFAHCGQSSKTLEQSYTEDDLIVRKPGFGLLLDHMPDEKDRFPILFPDDIDDGWNAVVLLIRECCMLKVIYELSDKQRWWEKINDNEIATKWKKEALAMGLEILS